MATAGLVLFSNFDNNTLNGGGATATVGWTGDEAASASDLLAIGPGGATFFHENGSLADSDTIYLDHNLNINPRADLRGFSFTFNPNSSYDLTSFSVDVGHATGTGGGQIFTSDLFVSIEDGNGAIFSDDSAMTHNRSFQNRSYDLTGLSLLAGTEYTVTVAMHDLVGNGAFFVSNGITLEGDLIAIPEPSSIWMLAAGVALMCRRKR